MTAPRVLVVGREDLSVVDADVRRVDARPLGVALRWRPDVIVLDAREAPQASAVIAELRCDFRTADLPIVHLVEEVPATIDADDDYVVWPRAADELRARVALAVSRRVARLGRNPLTGLPGNRELVTEIIARQVRGEAFVCVYIDIDGFKAFNDAHGFVRGDEVIVALARSIMVALDATAPRECFVAHLGGDDFVVLAPSDRAEALSAQIDVDGCTISIGVVERAELFTDALSVAQAAACAKAEAKARSRRSPA